ncbi:hypothetical protein Tcan_15193 [Toxocara canis]|uniref:BED-type domain-containing protein n=1 Tax=Toxocara canis TaxID=6265 RepID=A0A0B2UWW1_TOXCA|nr:hypothetical protein Tcan_15193 [Toxocara canis]
MASYRYLIVVFLLVLASVIACNVTNGARHLTSAWNVFTAKVHEVVQGGYKCPRCGGRELVGLNTTNAVEHLKVRHEAEYAQVVQELNHREHPVKRAAPSTTLEESWRMSDAKSDASAGGWVGSSGTGWSSSPAGSFGGSSASGWGSNLGKNNRTARANSGYDKEKSEGYLKTRFTGWIMNE